MRNFSRVNAQQVSIKKDLNGKIRRVLTISKINHGIALLEKMVDIAQHVNSITEAISQVIARKTRN